MNIHLNKKLAVYVHWPFCISKCPYCDFNSHVRDKYDTEAFAQSYAQEIRSFYQKIGNKTITSIFFGGGTPSLMPTNLVGQVISNLAKYFTIADDCEITLEANPSSIENNKMVEFKKQGINRVSIGVQSFNTELLKFLGRAHNVTEARQAIEIAGNLFDNYSFDLIYALPGQTLDMWMEELNLALSYKTKHLSLYQLTIEKGTPFYRMHKDKKFIMPSEEISASMYEYTHNIMEKNGYNHYEVSNFAYHDSESKHNMAYWKYQDYIGIGPGAHSRVIVGDDVMSFIMQYNPEKWLESHKTEQSAIQKSEKLSNVDVAKEMVMMGLRIKDGLNLDTLERKSKLKLDAVVNMNSMDDFIKSGLLQRNSQSLSLTNKGFLLLDYLVNAII